MKDMQLQGLGPHCKEPQWGPGLKTLEANAYNDIKRSKNLYFDTFLQVANQLLLTINSLMLSTIKLSKIRIR